VGIGRCYWQHKSLASVGRYSRQLTLTRRRLLHMIQMMTAMAPLLTFRWPGLRKLNMNLYNSC